MVTRRKSSHCTERVSSQSIITPTANRVDVEESMRRGIRFVDADKVRVVLE